MPRCELRNPSYEYYHYESLEQLDELKTKLSERYFGLPVIKEEQGVVYVATNHIIFRNQFEYSELTLGCYLVMGINVLDMFSPEEFGKQYKIIKEGGSDAR